jgi:hypothetical protein
VPTQAATFGSSSALTLQSNFPHIEIIGIFAPNVSLRAQRRNNSPTDETIFRFSRRHPETGTN